MAGDRSFSRGYELDAFYFEVMEQIVIDDRLTALGRRVRVGLVGRRLMLVVAKRFGVGGAERAGREQRNDQKARQSGWPSSKQPRNAGFCHDPGIISGERPGWPAKVGAEREAIRFSRRWSGPTCGFRPHRGESSARQSSQ